MKYVRKQQQRLIFFQMFTSAYYCYKYCLQQEPVFTGKYRLNVKKYGPGKDISHGL